MALCSSGFWEVEHEASAWRRRLLRKCVTPLAGSNNYEPWPSRCRLSYETVDIRQTNVWVRLLRRMLGLLFLFCVICVLHVE